MSVVLLSASAPTVFAVEVPLTDGAIVGRETALGEEVVAVALTALGSRYAWGGSSPATGFDCSGLTRWVYGHFGIPLPHSVLGQLGSGPQVGRDELEPGDLIIFRNTYRYGPSHTGIYLGEDSFLHAADVRFGVIISTLHNDYWRSRFVAGVRFARPVAAQEPSLVSATPDQRLRSQVANVIALR